MMDLLADKDLIWFWVWLACGGFQPPTFCREYFQQQVGSCGIEPEQTAAQQLCRAAAVRNISPDSKRNPRTPPADCRFLLNTSLTGKDEFIVSLGRRRVCLEIKLCRHSRLKPVVEQLENDRPCGPTGGGFGCSLGKDTGTQEPTD